MLGMVRGIEDRSSVKKQTVRLGAFFGVELEGHQFHRKSECPCSLYLCHIAREGEGVLSAP